MSAPELELITVPNGSCAYSGVRQAVDVDRGAGGLGEPAVARHVVGVVVGLEHVIDLDAEVAGVAEVLVDLEARVDDGGNAGVQVADEIGGTAEVVVHELTEDHALIMSGA